MKTVSMPLEDASRMLGLLDDAAYTITSLRGVADELRAVVANNSAAGPRSVAEVREHLTRIAGDVYRSVTVEVTDNGASQMSSVPPAVVWTLYVVGKKHVSGSDPEDALARMRSQIEGTADCSMVEGEIECLGEVAR